MIDTKAFTKLQYGMYVIGAGVDAGGKNNAQIANTFIQITSNPAQVLVSISKNNFTCSLIEQSKKFSASAISEDAPFEFIGKLGFKSGRDTNKLEGLDYKMSGGVPVVLNYATAIFELETVNEIDLTTHKLFIANVVNAEMIGGNTMTYGYYHKVKGGLTSKNAPTYIQK